MYTVRTGTLQFTSNKEKKYTTGCTSSLRICFYTEKKDGINDRKNLKTV